MPRRLSLVEQNAFTMNSPYPLDADRAKLRILGIARAFEWSVTHETTPIDNRMDADRSSALAVIKVALQHNQEDLLDDALKNGAWW
jgi:hypothetical protein